MQQKIVIKLRVPCEKCSSKAMALAAAADGVSSVTLEGADRDQVVVVGDGVDAVCLTTSLRKKVGCVLLVSVEEVKPKPKPKPTEEKKCGKPKDPPPCGCRTSNPPCHQPQLEMCKVAYDPYPPPCTIM
ncbi:hypothetical protein CJ030_MR0G027297 [Morella rubra]|uniref:HMA domain-containing protein n=1 Tax=Morella rubra TaxID=262757 RepID=A0A6A1UFK2_9ROSI|nr:hypothetical protein CJ030_MR0G027297 [Morella rubra]